jgi:PAS domain S-box-containing protein
MYKSSKFIYILFIIQICIIDYVHGQVHLKATEYENQNEMPTNLTKAITLDDLGFIWIATDAGLVKYNGQDYEVIKDDLPSQYVKNLVRLQNNNILVITDLGISEIVGAGNKYKIKSFIEGKTFITDSTLLYPKNAFEDSDGFLWISEPDAIVKYNAKTFERFQFDDDQRTDSYFRSFTIVEDYNKYIFASSQKGSIFYFDKKQNEFIKIFDFNDSELRIDDFILSEQGELLIATSKGIYELKYSLSLASVEAHKIFDVNDVSVISSFNGNSFLIGTWTNGVYLSSGKKEISKVEELTFDIISNLLVNDNGDVWVASDQGFALLQQTFFHTLEIDFSSYYIENVSKSNDNNVFVTDGNSVFFIAQTKGKFDKELIYTKKESLILCVTGTRDDFWVAYRDGFVERVKSDQVTRIYLPRTESLNRLVRVLRKDKHGNVWATEEGLKGVIRFDNNNEFTIYDSTYGVNGFIEAIAFDNHGNVYLGGTGNNSFLYRLNPIKNKFENISDPSILSDKENLRVNDIAFDSDDFVWLGTNHGLLKYDRNSQDIEFVSMEKYSKINIKSLAVDSDDRLWIGYEYGVLLLSHGIVSRFGTNDGLPNLTTTYRSAVIDNSDRLIIGTAHGLAYLQRKIIEESSTRSPLLTSIKLNSNLYEKSTDDLSINRGTYIELNYVTLTYPNEGIRYRWRVIGRDTTWSDPFYETRLGITNLDAGEYTLEIISQKTGYSWSKPARLAFAVTNPWYTSSLAVIFYLFVVIVFVIVVVHYISILKQKRSDEEKIKSFFKLSNDLLIIIGTDGSIKYANQTWFDKLNYSRKQIHLKNFFDLFESESKDNLKTAIKNLQNNQNTVPCECSIKNKSGETLFYSWNFAFSVDGNTIYGVGRDITEVMQMQNKLVELNAHKDKIFSVISHDLRSPFNSLLGYTQMLIDDFESFSSSEIKEIINSNYRSTKKAFDLLEDLLNWSKVQINIVLTSKEKVHLDSLLYDEIERFGDQIKFKKLKIIMDIDNINCEIDENSYRIVFRNILSNAIKFSNVNDELKIELKEQDNNIICKITDNGTGIEPDKLKKMQNKEAVDSEYGTSGEKGNGMGYELIHNYAKINDGKVNIDSKIGEGTFVEFII